MGNNSSKFVKKIVSPFGGTIEPSGEEKSRHIFVKSPSQVPVLVLKRTGSMFFDEEGDLAHEFYMEVPSKRKGCKASMKRIYQNLHPQGEVNHQYPRLHVDCPVILYQV